MGFIVMSQAEGNFHALEQAVRHAERHHGHTQYPAEREHKLVFMGNTIGSRGTERTYFEKIDLYRPDFYIAGETEWRLADAPDIAVTTQLVHETQTRDYVFIGSERITPVTYEVPRPRSIIMPYDQRKKFSGSQLWSRLFPNQNSIDGDMFVEPGKINGLHGWAYLVIDNKGRIITEEQP